MTTLLGTTIAMAMLAAVPVTEPALRTALLDTARVPVEGVLGKPVRFKVVHLARDGDWAFLLADMQGGDGSAVDLAGTPLDEAARNGMASRSCAVLLHRVEGKWAVVEAKVGPTDVAWSGWAIRHQAPASIFRM